MDEQGEVIEAEEVPLAGDIVLLQIEGLVGKLVWAMQALNGDFSKWTHAGIMLDDGTIFEAQPGGAVMTDWALYKDRPFAIVRYQQVAHSHGAVARGWNLRLIGLNDYRRMDIVGEARMHVGAGYNWTTYFYLAGYRLGIRPKWLRARVQNSKKLICSQAVDEIYDDIGVHLFADGRMPYDVTPGDLARLLVPRVPLIPDMV